MKIRIEPPKGGSFHSNTDKYKMINKFGNMVFSVGEQEIIQLLQDNFNQSFIQAVDHVIRQKRDQAMIWRRRGHDQIADQLLKEIGELK